MQRLLCIVGGMNAGGAETFLMKIYRTIDREKYQMDFAVAINEKGFYDDEILDYGGRIFHISPKSAGLIKNYKEIKEIVKTNDYQSVLRVSQHALSALELRAARKGGAKICGFRSSNSNTTTGSRKSRILHKLCMFMPRMYANVRIAPSTEAAEYMFGRGCIQKNRAQIVHNGVDLSVYRFREEDRNRIRGEFSLNDSLVIGHVGRFNQQKNHGFLIKVFSEIKKRNENAKLLLVGTGEKEREIRELVSQNDLSDSVVFAGVRSDVPALLSAMDVFVFPSFYEGMPNVVIEAQACGLPCVVSDRITKEAKLTPVIEYLPLSLSASEWAEKAISLCGERVFTHQDIVEQGYDIDSSAQAFVKLLFKEDEA